MSGVYLIVWDNHKSFDRVLNPTSGGWPHITLAYTGKNLNFDELREVAKESLHYWLMKQVTLVKAEVNSFFHEKSGKERHDVLLIVQEQKEIEASRDSLLRTRFPTRQEKFNMRQAHVTAKILWSKEEAEAEAARLNALMPLSVTVTGVTID